MSAGECYGLSDAGQLQWAGGQTNIRQGPRHGQEGQQQFRTIDPVFTVEVQI